ncbi:class I SAM-dependent methyltransferase [Lacticaseibacillus baoqingensis]|uniref:Class I SAM-dependent methyltransferase n=1 Tax=Lacticaseibacillus baoqingensis TaxID=2486013 RepID=A0ABW4E903_9LACO|nr:class I SAM-dependent methyltransferase [Lacticaseibacillus baoqingensis]
MDTPKQWDDFAATYAAVQRESTLPIETDVAAALDQQFPLAQLTVADIAAGSGRYSLPLAQHAKHVLLVDWSKQMLAAAKAWLDPHQLDNVAYQQQDWLQLPAKPLADLVFVSQLPTLKASELLLLERLATHAVAINSQSQQHDHLQAIAAAKMGWPLPLSYQADPKRTVAYQRLLTAHHRHWQRQVFTYHRQQLTTTTELLQSFARPFGLKQATQLAQALGAETAQAPIPTTITYRFELLTWPVFQA